MLKITYIGHSGFLVELAEVYLLFDYYQGKIPTLKEEKKLMVFVSHSHGDHYNPQIFDLRKLKNPLTYILAEDVSLLPQYAENFSDFLMVKANQELSLGDCYIRTFRSTDEGVAYLVKYLDQTIYHAGDLNWWHWSGETDSYNEKMKEDYQREINKFSGEVIDVAFVPVDLRLEKAYVWGMNYFMANTKTTWVVPMHFWKDYYVFDLLAQEESCESYRSHILRLEEGEEITLEKTENEIKD